MSLNLTRCQLFALGVGAVGAVGVAATGIYYFGVTSHVLTAATYTFAGIGAATCAQRIYRWFYPEKKKTTMWERCRGAFKGALEGFKSPGASFEKLAQMSQELSAKNLEELPEQQKKLAKAEKEVEALRRFANAARTVEKASLAAQKGYPLVEHTGQSPAEGTSVLKGSVDIQKTADSYLKSLYLQKFFSNGNPSGAIRPGWDQDKALNETSEKLEESVLDGTLTAKEKDAIFEKIKKGI